MRIKIILLLIVLTAVLLGFALLAPSGFLF